MNFSITAFKSLFSKRLSKVQVTELVCVVSDSKELFDELIYIIINGNKHEAFMGSWVLQYAAIEQPDWFYEHLHDLLLIIESKRNESVLRCITRIIWKTPIPKEMDGIVTQKCIEWIENKENPIAVKAFSLHTLSKIIEHEPALCNEIRYIDESVLPYSSSGLNNAAEKLLKKIRKMG